MSAVPPVLASFGGAFEFIFTPQNSNVTGGKSVGGFHQVVELALTQLEVTVLALALALVIALPAGLYFGHRGTGELLAIGLGNAGRAIPELALIALMAAVIGVGLLNLTVALAILGIPPILTNTFVGIRQVDRFDGPSRSRDGDDRVRDRAQGRGADGDTEHLHRHPHGNDQHRRHRDDRATCRSGDAR